MPRLVDKPRITRPLGPTVRRVVDCLYAGGVILLPTDTVLGLAALPMNTAAVAKLYRLKNRPSERRLPVMVASTDQLPILGVDVTPAAKRLLTSRYVPGPLTIALGFAGSKPSWLSERDEVAVRIPADPLLLSILREAGPMFVTSANCHGNPTPQTTSDAIEQLDGMPDLVIEGHTNDTVPSTLVNCHFDPPTIERIGAISSAEIEMILS